MPRRLFAAYSSPPRGALLESRRRSHQVDRLATDGDRRRPERDRHPRDPALHRAAAVHFFPSPDRGALGYAGTVVLFVFATRMTTAANAIFLQYTAPIYVALIGRWYLGERASRIDWLVIAVALAGIALFFFDRLTVAGLWGNILALGSGLAFASVALFLRKEKAGSPVASIVLGNVIVALAGAPFMFQAPSLGEDGLWRLVLLGAVQLRLALCLLRDRDQAGQRPRSNAHPVARAGIKSALGHARARGTARPVGNRRRVARAQRGPRPRSDDDANQATDDSASRLTPNLTVKPERIKIRGWTPSERRRLARAQSKGHRSRPKKRLNPSCAICDRKRIRWVRVGIPCLKTGHKNSS